MKKIEELYIFEEDGLKIYLKVNYLEKSYKIYPYGTNEGFFNIRGDKEKIYNQQGLITLIDNALEYARDLLNNE